MYQEGNGILGNLKEYEDLINELSEKEVYQVKAMEIEATTDFKALYGKNNADIRKQHISQELADWYTTIKDLEFSIDYISRRISFLRELIRTKRVLMEVKG